MNDDGIDKGKSKKGDKGSGGENSDKKEEISQVKLMEIAKALVDKTMLLSIFTYFKHDNVDDCFNALENDNSSVDGIDVLEKDMYLETLLLGMNDVDKIDIGVIKFIYNNIFDKNIINKKLYVFNQNVNLIYNSIEENKDIISVMLPNLVELIDSYLKPSKTEKRLLGEVFTPLYGKPGCVEDQLNLMDESFWKRKDVKVLDPCAGIGNYSVVLVDKFMKGLADEIEDTEERLKWILENIIYINEYQSKNLFIYLQLFDPENKYKMNFNRGDYLKLDIKKTFGVDKFDLICMNSPYQEMDGGAKASARPLYNHFIEKAITESDKIISINPSRWFAGGKGLNDFRKKMLFNNNIKKIIHITDPTIIFGKGVEIKGGISYMIIDNNYQGNCNFNGIETDLSKYDILVEPNYFNILNKLLKFANNGLDKICIGRGDNVFGIQTNDKKVCDNGELVCYMSKQKGFKMFIDKKNVKKNIYVEKWKVITSRASGSNKLLGVFGNSFIGKPNEVYSGSYISFIVNSKEEAKSLLSYINSKFSNFMLSLRKISQDIKPDTCKWIPIVPFDREWSDEQLFEYFNLTEDERNIILNYDNNRK